MAETQTTKKGAKRVRQPVPARRSKPNRPAKPAPGRKRPRIFGQIPRAAAGARRRVLGYSRTWRAMIIRCASVVPS